MDNLSVELLAKSPVRAEIPIPGTPLIGIEVSNEKATTVFLNEVLTSPKMMENKSPTTVALGKDIAGSPILCDLMDMPHLLIAGATGSGKSVCINSIITSLLYRSSPQDVRLILVDPKFVELQPYNGCPHLLLPVITDDKKVVAALEWLCEEMDERYQKMQVHNVRNIDNYNRRIGPDEEKMPRIVMIIDEMADLIATSGKAVEEYVKRLTAKARAAGICLILATQRPSVDVITGIIKANIPSRIAFQVSSQVDSRTILDMVGAEKLLGYGDMLYMPRNYPAPARVQGCFISDKDVEAVTEYVKSRNQLNYNMDIMEYIDKAENADQQRASDSFADEGEVFDDLLPEAIEMAVEAGQTSISMLQRVLRVGYGRAGRLIDEMDRRGIISGNEGTKPRKTLLTRDEYSRLMEAGDPKVT
jgi:S-DNA-T family DNA segregation ATPase FtsK/SpoIIIE